MFLLEVFVSLCALFLAQPVKSTQCGKATDYHAVTRYYCLSAVTIDWDYAVNSNETKNDLTGLYDDRASELLSRNGSNVGKMYRKVLLKQYPYEYITHTCKWNDEFYSSAYRRNGIMGPVIRAVVGDSIVVHFLNKADSLDSEENGFKQPSFNLVPQGLQYEVDVNTGIAGYGDEVVYQWEAHQASGPGESETKQFSSTVWMYSSAVNPAADMSTGLMGPIVVVDPRYVPSERHQYLAQPCDVDEEMFLLASKIDETQSWFWTWNKAVAEYGGAFPLYSYGDDENAVNSIDSRRSSDTTVAWELLEEEIDSEEKRLNTKYSLNGFSYGNLNPNKGLVVPEKSVVRWYVLGFSLDSDLSAVPLVWKGHSLVNARGHSQPSVLVHSPGGTVADMHTKSAASKTWLLLADREDCVSGGMSAVYKVGYVTQSGSHHTHGDWRGTAGAMVRYEMRYAGNNEKSVAALFVSVVAVVGMVVLYIKASRQGMIGYTSTLPMKDESESSNL